MWTNKYLYNGKELQNELGLDWYDYGARMYDAQLGRFFTQDRFAEKYNDFSPYHYCANNPIIFVDVNGDSLWIQVNKDTRALYVNGQLYNKDGTAYTGAGTKVDKNGNRVLTGFLKSTVGALNQISNGKEGKGMISELQSSASHIVIQKSSSSGNRYDIGNKTVEFDPNSTQGGLNTSGKTDRPAYIGLAHELAHGLDHIRGTLNLRQVPGFTFTESEKFATHMENLIRSENNLPLRTHYGLSGKNTGVFPLIDNLGYSIYYGTDYLNRSQVNQVTPLKPNISNISLTPHLKPIKIGL